MPTPDIFARLSAPFPPEAISWRVGSTNIDKQTGKPRNASQEPSGIALAYLDARDVMDRLDEVCGPAGWQCRYPHVGSTTVCDIGILVDDAWIWKADGAGATDVEAEKGMLSDALKRAAVRWGIGRYLYGLDSPWVPIEPMGKSWKISKRAYVDLRRLLEGKKPVTANAAKKEGGGERFNELKHEIGTLESPAACSTWANARADEITAMPTNWRTMLREALTEQRKLVTLADDDFPGDRPMQGRGAAQEAAPALA